jgi:hypothetical protein
LLGVAVQTLYQAAVFGDSPLRQFRDCLSPIIRWDSVRRRRGVHPRLSDTLNRYPEGFRNIVVIDSGAKAVRRFSEVHVNGPVDKLSVYEYIYISLLETRP